MPCSPVGKAAAQLATAEVTARPWVPGRKESEGWPSGLSETAEGEVLGLTSGVWTEGGCSEALPWEASTTLPPPTASRAALAAARPLALRRLVNVIGTSGSPSSTILVPDNDNVPALRINETRHGIMGGMGGAPYTPGSDADFDRLYRESYGRILATLRAMFRNNADAEDCAQETFANAYRAWSSWKPDAPAEAWLHRIAINAAISHRRRERLRQPLELVRRLGHPAPPPDPTDARRPTLIDALRRLPPDRAAMVILRHLHGYSNREIAAALKVPESTVSSRLVAAKARLTVELAALGIEARGVSVVAEAPSSVPVNEYRQGIPETR
jgi:RNA polymerase sigma factor (sigma-70 family)